jgi:hypothetical protein
VNVSLAPLQALIAIAVSAQADGRLESMTISFIDGDRLNRQRNGRSNK